MIKKIIKYTTIALFSMITLHSKGQELNKNMITINAWLGAEGFGIGYNLAYERLLIKSNSFFKYYGLKVSIGESTYYSSRGTGGESWPDHFPAFYAHIMGLTGKKKSHLELALGVAVLTNTKDSTYPITEVKAHSYFSMKVGYRYQKPEGHFVFSVGTGFPQMAYVSLGTSF